MKRRVVFASFAWVKIILITILLSCIANPSDALMMADSIVIAEVNPNDGAAGTEYVVLYNPTPDTVTFPAGFRIRLNSGTARALTNPWTTSIAGFSFYKIARPNTVADSDAYFGTATGEIALDSSSAAISWDGATWFDKVSWGTYTGSDFEDSRGNILLTSGRSVTRKPQATHLGGASIDTNSNQLDFTYNSIKISRNRTSPRERTVFHVTGPASITLGSPFTLLCTAVVSSNGVTYNDSVVTAYTGVKAWGNISVSSGSISPDTTGASAGFSSGVRSLSVTVTAASDPVTISVADAYCTGSVTIPLASVDTPNAATRISPATPHDTDTRRPQFTWRHNDTTASPQAKYHLQLSTSSTFTSITYEETGTTTETTVTIGADLSSPADSTLYWRVQTSNSGDGFSPYASGDSIVVVHLNPPSAPTLTSPTADHETISRSVRFAWTHVDSDASSQDSFTIQVSKQSDFSSIWAQDTQSSSNQFYDTTFPSLSDTYYWRVATRDKIAFGAWSDTRKIVQADTIPIVVISEICVGSSDSNFVELFVVDDRNNNQGADLSGWRLYTTTTGAATLRKTFGSLSSIKESSFVTIYFATTKTDDATDGSDSRVNLYTTSTNGTMLTSQGVIQVLSHRTADTRDVVIYSDQATLNSAVSEHLAALVSSGHWGPTAVAANTAPDTGLSANGNALRRDGAFTDGNTKNDWSLDSQTGGNYPLSYFRVTTDSAAPYATYDSFNLAITAFDSRNDTIIGARFRPAISISAGSITPGSARFVVDHSDFNSGDTSIAVGVYGTSGTQIITATSNGLTGTTAVNVQSTHESFLVEAPMQVKRSSDFLLRLRALDASGGFFTSFTGVVTLTASSGTITPASRTFIASENGDTTFLAQLSGVGPITITATSGGKSGTLVTAPLLDTSFYISEFLTNDTNRPGESEDRGEFVEIRNNGHTATAITGYTLLVAPNTTDRNYTFPALTVPRGGYVVVHFNQGGTDDLSFSDTDGAANLFAANSVPAMSPYDDALPHSSVPFGLALFATSTQDETNIVDFVGVDGGASSDINLKDTVAVNAGIWTNDATLNLPTTAGNQEGRTFYRIVDGRDSNGIGSSEWSTIASDGSTESYRFTEGCTNVNSQPGGAVSIALATTSSPTGDTFVSGDTIYITLTAATDGDANARNSTNVKVYSNDTDLVGIIVKLTETANNSKIFVGEAYASRTPMESNDGMRTIAAEPGDTLTVEWVVSPTVSSSVAATGALDHFNVTPSATTINQGDQVDLRTIAKDGGDFTITSFTGAVTITSSDSLVYPSSWNFTAPDLGDTIAKVIFGAGPGTITVTVTSGSKTGTTTITILADTNYLINEVMPAPRGAGGIDWNGDAVFNSSDEWVELYNKGTTALPLDGYGIALTGDNSPIVLQGSIPARGYVTIYGGNGSSYHFDSMGVIVDTKTGLTGGFALTNTGGSLELRRVSDSAVIAAVSYPDQGTNRDSSYGRGPDGVNAWYTYKKASPGKYPTPSPDSVSNPNALFQVDAPESAIIGTAFTLNVALLARNGDTLISFSDTANLVSLVNGVISPTSVSFFEGVASLSATYTSGTPNDTSALYVRLQGAISGNDSVLLVTSNPDVTPPAAPTGLAALAYIAGPETGVRLSWNNNSESDVVGYQVWRGTTNDPLAATTLIFGGTITDTVRVDSTVVAGGTYYHFVVALDTAGNRSDTAGGVTAPYFSTIKTAESTTLGMVPGSSLQYKIEIQNAGYGPADTVVLFDTIPSNAVFRDTVTLPAGWEFQYCTGATPNQAYTSTDYVSGDPATPSDVRFVRWRKLSVSPADAVAVIRFRVIIQ